MEKLEPLRAVGENLKWCSLVGDSMAVLKKLKIELLYDSAIPPLGI